KSTNDPASAADLIIEAAYWAPAVMEREDRLMQGAFPGKVGGWFSGLNNLTHRISNGSTLALVPMALSGLVRHVPGIPRIHWPTLRWAGSNFVGDIVPLPVPPHSRGALGAVHGCVDQALRRLAEQAPDAPLIVVAHS